MEHLDGSAVEKVAELAREALNGEARIVEVEGDQFSTTQLYPVLTPKADEPAALKVRTLTAIGDYIENNIDGLELEDVMIHVVDPGTVNVISGLQQPRAQRFTFLTALADDRLGGLRFGQFYTATEMIIALQSRFDETEHRTELIQLLSNIRGENVQTSLDDGVTQEVEVAARVHVKGTVKVPSPALLRPFRTFPEVEQPQSPFVIRVQRDPRGDGFQATLIEADGGAWRMEAIKRVAGFLGAELGTKVTIIS